MPAAAPASLASPTNARPQPPAPASRATACLPACRRRRRFTACRYDGRRSAAEAKRVAKELAKNAAADRARMAKNGERPRPGTGSSRPGTGAGGKTKLPALKAVGNAAVVAGALQKAGGKAPPKTAWA